MSIRWLCWIATLAVGVGFVEPLRADENDRGALNAPVDSGEIAGLIRDLSDPSYERRMFASRRLVAIGRAAHAPLTKAARGGDLEAALRAQRILRILDSVWFSGCELTIKFSRSEIRWDQPVELLLTVANKSAFPAAVPFELNDRSRPPRHAEAERVARMLDVAEWLQVFGPTGELVQLRVDDIAADPQVVAVVQDRLNGGPVSELAPGKRVEIAAPVFNRGWARFPLLEAGEYSAVFDYTPRWEDDALAAAEVGRVRSNTAKLTVIEAAPPTVSRGGTEAALALVRDGEAVVARLINRRDVPIVVNRNFGNTPPFAEAAWRFEAGETSVEIPVAGARKPSWDGFEADKLVEVEAGQFVELDRMKVDALRRAFKEQGADLSSGSWSVRFSYVNLCGRGWQGREAATLRADSTMPRVLREPLSRRLLVLHLTSPPMPATSLK